MINTNLSSEEVLRLVSENIAPPRSLFQAHIPEKAFEGSVASDGFTINRIIHGRNSFLPVLNGRFSSAPRGTKIDLYLAPHPIVIIFLLIIFAPFLEMIFVALRDFVLLGQIGGSSLSQFGILSGCLYAIGLISFGLESRKAEEFVKKVLKRGKVTNQP